MKTLKCVKKLEYNGKYVGLEVTDEEGAHFKLREDKVKQLISNGQAHIINVTLDAGGKFRFTEPFPETQQLTKEEFEGTKKTNPAVADDVKGQLANIEQLANTLSEVDLSNKKIAVFFGNALKSIKEDTDRLNSKMDTVIENQDGIKKITKESMIELGEALDEAFDGISNMNEATSANIAELKELIQNGEIEKANKQVDEVIRPAVNELIKKYSDDYMLEEKIFNGPATDSIKSDGVLFEKYGRINENEEKYNSMSHKYSGDDYVVPFDELEDIKQYVNFAHNLLNDICLELKERNKINLAYEADTDALRLANFTSLVDMGVAVAEEVGSVAGLVGLPKTLLNNSRKNNKTAKAIQDAIDNGDSTETLEEANTDLEMQIKNVGTASDTASKAISKSNGLINKIKNYSDINGKLTKQHFQRKRAKKLLDSTFSNMNDVLDDINLFLDKRAYQLASEYIYSKNTPDIISLNKNGIRDRAILKMLKHARIDIDIDTNATLKALESTILACYLATDMYIRYNIKLNDDISESEVNRALAKERTTFGEIDKEFIYVSIKRKTADDQRVLYRQYAYNTLFISYFAAALTVCGVAQTTVYNTIINLYKSFLRQHYEFPRETDIQGICYKFNDIERKFTAEDVKNGRLNIFNYVNQKIAEKCK